MKSNSTASAKAVLFGVLFSVSCSSDKTGAGSDGGAGNVSTDGAVMASGGASGATHASGGKGGSGGGGTNAGGSGTQNRDASTAGSGGADGSTGVDGSTGTDGSAGAGGASANGRGGITITQVTTSGTYFYSVSAGFARSRGTVQGNSGETCTATTSGSCIASVCTFSNADSGSSTPPSVSGLNAGVIDVNGAGTSKARLTYGPIVGTKISAYKRVEDASRFFMGGDQLSVVGAGGADLPAFAAQTLTAPNEVVLTAPACAAGCPPVDRTKDMAVTWTGGGAGKLTVTLETVATDSVTIATCAFDAKGGTGTVPKGILGLLGKAGDATTTGVESFISGNSTAFMVGDLPTTFTVNSEVAQGSLTVSK